VSFPFVLVHSPHVGPMTWKLVADELRDRGMGVVTPGLPQDGADPGPHWRTQANAIVSAVDASGLEGPPILVGHDGAGPLLPAVRMSLGRAVRGYIFVNSKLPRDGASRLDLLGDQRAVALFRAAASDRLLLTWSYEELRSLIPDDSIRRRFVKELAPISLPVYEEPLPVFDDWPDAPCAYLRLSSVYARPAEDARRANWPTAELEADHYHMLVDPAAVAEALLELVARWSRRGMRAARPPQSPRLMAEQALDIMLSPFDSLER
jgi:hypothetical protein